MTSSGRAPTGVGHSLVVGPTGVVRAGLGNGPGLLVADVDPGSWRPSARPSRCSRTGASERAGVVTRRLRADGQTEPVDKQTEFVLRAIEERDVRFVRMWFTDVLGFLKSVAIAPAELEGAFAEGMGFDGSAIEGFARVYESDMVAHPDPATFQVLPWRDTSPATARMFCDIIDAGRLARPTPTRATCSSGR